MNGMIGNECFKESERSTETESRSSLRVLPWRCGSSGECRWRARTGGEYPGCSAVPPRFPLSVADGRITPLRATTLTLLQTNQGGNLEDSQKPHGSRANPNAWTPVEAVNLLITNRCVYSESETETKVVDRGPAVELSLVQIHFGRPPCAKTRARAVPTRRSAEPAHSPAT